MNGNFELQVPAGQNILQISFIGYKEKEITIGNNRKFNIQLSVESEQLNEVVVTALGIKREKKALGYAMQEVNINPEKPDVPLNKNDAFQKVQKRRVQEKR